MTTQRQLDNRENPVRWDSLNAQASAPNFGRRHYVFIADTINQVRDHTPSSQERADDTARVFAHALATTNPNFNRERFLRACGVES